MALDARTPGQILRALRLERDWTRNDVANHLYELCDLEGGQDSGINADTVGRWERDVARPSQRYQVKLSKLYGKSLEDLGFAERQDTSKSSQEALFVPSASPEIDVLENHSSTITQPSTQISFPLNEIIPLPPRPYFAHPYPLQENFTGRLQERQVLSEWLAEMIIKF